jgi:hypothetical protein
MVYLVCVWYFGMKYNYIFMTCFLIHIREWFYDILCRALERAYISSKKIRSIQRDYICYKKKGLFKRSFYNVSLYMDFVLNKYSWEIYWALFQFKVSKYMIYMITFLCLKDAQKKDLFSNWNWLTKLKTPFLQSLNAFDLKCSINRWCLDKKNFLKKIQNFVVEPIVINTQSSYCGLLSKNGHRIQMQSLDRKIAWIEATLIDLDILKCQCWELSALAHSALSKSNMALSVLSSNVNPKTIAYESVGLVPRSITRTLSRFQIELAGRSVSLILPEFRLAKYQAVASLQYMVCLIVVPFVLSSVSKIVILEPLVQNWWNTSQSQIAINALKEQKALIRLQEMEELLWLDIMIADIPKKNLKEISVQIHQNTVELVEIYNQNSIDTILYLLLDLLSFSTIALLLTWGKKRLAILNSWIQELFYSLSDTMKAFFILLFTDLCIGFHSPHGWEILIGFLLEHVGFSHNQNVISCFVSTFPVILDTVFKYWIFRHLNRISPSIVVTYHTMNE